MECNVVTSPIGDNNPAIDYFDPTGVAELRRTLSASSPTSHHHTSLSDRPPLSITHLRHHDGDSRGRLNPQNVPAHSITAGSDETTVAPSEASNDGVERQGGQEVGFDFDEALRDYIVRCV